MIKREHRERICYDIEFVECEDIENEIAKEEDTDWFILMSWI